MQEKEQQAAEREKLIKAATQKKDAVKKAVTAHQTAVKDYEKTSTEAIGKLKTAKDAEKKTIEADVKAKEDKVQAALKAIETAKAAYKTALLKACQYQGEAKPETVKDSKTYIPEINVRKFMHLELDKPKYDGETGKKRSKAYIQLYTLNNYRELLKQPGTLGYTVKVLWDGAAYSEIEN